ncbi:MAG: hypothetical protein ACR2GA_04085 [Chloroflexota bacterium]
MSADLTDEAWTAVQLYLDLARSQTLRDKAPRDLSLLLHQFI